MSAARRLRDRASRQPNLLCEDTVVAVNPWEPHNFLPNDLAHGALFLVLYVNAEWFAGVRGLRFGCTQFRRTATLDRNDPGRRRPWSAARPRSTVSTASCAA